MQVHLIKGPFRDPQPHLSKKVTIFTSAEAFKVHNVCVIKIVISFLWRNWWSNCLLCRHNNYQHSGLYVTVWYSKTCITHKRNLRIDWNFGNMLLLSASTDSCHKNNMLGLQNRPLMSWSKSFSTPCSGECKTFSTPLQVKRLDSKHVHTFIFITLCHFDHTVFFIYRFS